MERLTVPPLAPGEIHVWTAWLDPPPEGVVPLRHLLSTDENNRAARFHFEVHRRRYVVRRGLLRCLVGAYLDRDPASLVFDYGEREKPSVQGELEKEAGERFEFNLSDSDDLVVYAFARGAEIGVDVEMLRPMPDALSISESFFSDGEREVLRGVEPQGADRLAEAFFNCWTRKEAYLKAIGTGLAEPLGSFSSTLLPGDKARFLHFDKDRVDAWSLFHLRPTSDSVGALALRERDWTVRECGAVQGYAPPG